MSESILIVSIVETVGYIGRSLAHDQTGALPPYIMQSILLLLAPVLFAASLYMTLGRAIVAIRGEQHSFIPPRWLTRVFVAGDVMSFLVQASGAGLIVKSGADSASLGENIIVGGLILQVIMFGLFCSVAATFNFRFRKSSTTLRGEAASIPWQKTLNMLYITSACIMVRNVFRVVEYAQGQKGYTLTHEWCTYIFDAVLMLCVMVTFGFYCYPSNIVRKPGPSVDHEAGVSDEQLNEDVGKVWINNSHGWR